MFSTIFSNVASGDLLFSISLLIGTGIFAGFIAGLFGIGGGVVVVPALYYIFTLAEVDESIRMHLAVGTSLANIVPISIISAVSHARKNSVNIDFLKFIFVSIIVGVTCGSIAVSYLEGSTLILIYSIILLFVAAQFFFWHDKWRLSSSFPKNMTGHGFGSVIGFLSVIIGVGGGSISIPILKLYNFEIHKAIGTAAGIGTIVAVPGTIGFMIAGLQNNVDLPLSFGYVSLVGLILITPITIIGAPIGVRFAHYLSKSKLNLLFGIFILFMSIRFYLEWLSLTS